jgi:pSer/pThr/pTyr-binding forkhead associated (FHA) protein
MISSIPPRPKCFLILNGHQVYDITKPITRIGSDPGSDIVITDPAVSSTRAEIVFSEGMFILLDRNSKDPPRIDGENITARQLSPGDMIQFGRDNILFGWYRSVSTRGGIQDK